MQMKIHLTINKSHVKQRYLHIWTTNDLGKLFGVTIDFHLNGWNWCERFRKFSEINHLHQDENYANKRIVYVWTAYRS